MNMTNKIQKGEFPSDYKPFLQDILTKIQRARYEMLMSVSKQTLLLYWDIGKMVSEKIELAGWGNSVVEQLAKDLQKEFPGVRGFSARNIWRMKMFAEFYATLGISATMVAKIETPPNSATAVAELEIEENHQSLAVIVNSAPSGAEMQAYVYDLVKCRLDAKSYYSRKMQGVETGTILPAANQRKRMVEIGFA